MNRKLINQILLGLLLDDEGDGGGGGDDKAPVDELSQDLADLEGGDEEAEEEESEEDSDEDSEEEGEESQDDEEAEGKSKKKKNEKEGEEEEEPEETGDRKITVKALKAAFPDIFKKFPELKSAFFLAPKFLEVFPDPESAKEAATKATEFDALEGSLVGKGDPTLLLKTLNDNNPKAFKQVAKNLLDAVKGIDEDAYVTMTNPIIEELCYFAMKHGEKIGNKNLVLAAKHISNFVFANGGEITDVSKRETKSKEPSEAEKTLDKERNERAQEKFSGAVTSIAELISPEINKVITNKLDECTAFERKQIVKETREELDRLLGKDQTFQSTLKGLWKRAQEANYSEESKSRIRRAWLDRARTLAPGIRNRLRQEALDARTGKSSEEEDDKKSSAGKKRTFNSNNGSSGKKSGAGLTDPKKIDWRKTSDLDIIG